MATPRYYVDLYDPLDVLDGCWGTWGAAPERLFDSLDEARACRDRLNAALDDDPHGRWRTHWGIIDREAASEIECVWERLMPVPSAGAVTELLE